jgi:hypothetical protein
MVKSEGVRDHWHRAIKRGQLLITCVHAPVEGCKETPREDRRAGDVQVLGLEAGMFRTWTIIRLDCHVWTDAMQQPTPFGRCKYTLGVHLNKFTAWLMFYDPTRAADVWLRLTGGGKLRFIMDIPWATVAALGPFEPRLVTGGTLLHFGTFWRDREAHWEDVAKVKAMGIRVPREPLDDFTRRQLWVPDLIPRADAETEAAAMAALARALDTLERESADPDTRERCRLTREALERQHS